MDVIRNHSLTERLNDLGGAAIAASGRTFLLTLQQKKIKFTTFLAFLCLFLWFNGSVKCSRSSIRGLVTVWADVCDNLSIFSIENRKRQERCQIGQLTLARVGCMKKKAKFSFVLNISDVNYSRSLLEYVIITLLLNLAILLLRAGIESNPGPNPGLNLCPNPGPNPAQTATLQSPRSLPD